MHTPGPVRPQRPARCSAEARAIGSTGRRCTPVRCAYRLTLAVPASMTKRTPGTVSEVSATFVASTTRRRPQGVNSACWRSADIRAWSGNSSVSASPRRPSRASVSRISRSPERNTSTSPGSSRISSSAPATLSGTSSPSSPGRYRISTGWVRPSTSTTGAPSKNARSFPTSRVAEATTTRSSGRRRRSVRR